ncbi:WD repeat-containing protein 13-like [Diadema antillarum]|uniref:WD repeat-containing protein 13-like n=1 Tax=Diadema antillarum TaxID=105358 RepID=UPI003A8938E7
MTMATMWQQILAIDARYNTYRTPNNPQFRTLYIRRRSQLLRDSASSGLDPQIRKQYMKQRIQLLTERYGANISMSDQGSLRSRSASMMGSRTNLDMLDDSLGDFRTHRRQHSKGSFKLDKEDDQMRLVPTRNADASKAMAGGTTLAENYAFTGMHHIFDHHQKAVTAVKFANDDKSRIACSSLDKTISVCQVLPSPATVVCTLKGHTKGVTDFCWSLSNDLILSCSLDGTARLWVVSSGSCARTVTDPQQSPLLSCCFQPLNNNMVVTGNARGGVQVLNVSTGKPTKGGQGKLTGQVLCLTFDDTGALLWGGDDKGVISSFQYDMATGKLSKGKRLVVCEGSPITCLSFRAWASREARDPLLLINCAINQLCLYRVTGSDGEVSLKKTFSIKHRKENVRSSFCPLMSFREGACVVSGSEDMTVYFFDIERTAKPCVNKLQGHSAPVLGVGFNYDESLLATSDAEGLVIVWKRHQDEAVTATEQT